VFENVLAVRSQTDDHLPPISMARRANHQIAKNEAIHQANSALMLKKQPLGERSDGAGLAYGHRFDSQHRLVLPGLNPFFKRDALAEVEEAADLVPKFGQFFVIGARHNYIVLRYNYRCKRVVD